MHNGVHVGWYDDAYADGFARFEHINQGSRTQVAFGESGIVDFSEDRTAEGARLALNAALKGLN